MWLDSGPHCLRLADGHPERRAGALTIWGRSPSDGAGEGRGVCGDRSGWIIPLSGGFIDQLAQRHVAFPETACWKKCFFFFP